MPSPAYDPLNFWNEKATRSGGDPNRAVCHEDPAENQCIDRVQRSMVRAALQRISAHPGWKGLRVLDYGCGSGRWAPLFLERECLYSGVDISPAMLDLARAQNPGADFNVVTDNRIPYPTVEFDLVVSIATIHHNPPDQQELILDEIARVLKPAGHLVLFESVGNPDPNNPVEYARLKQDWIRALAERGMGHVWYRGGRYFILCSMADRFLRVLYRGRPRGTKRRPNAILATDALLDPILGRLLPERYQHRGVFVFHKLGTARG